MKQKISTILAVIMCLSFFCGAKANAAEPRGSTLVQYITSNDTLSRFDTKTEKVDIIYDEPVSDFKLTETGVSITVDGIAGVMLIE